MSYIRNNGRLVVVAVCCVALGAGVSAIATAGASTGGSATGGSSTVTSAHHRTHHVKRLALLGRQGGVEGAGSFVKSFQMRSR